MKYKLCLFYSTNKYFPLFDKEYSSFGEIDSYTMRFGNEEQFRKDSYIANTCNSIYNSYYYYINKIQSAEARKGKIVIVSQDEDGDITYIKPLYKDTAKQLSPKYLMRRIKKILNDENSIRLLNDFLRNFNKTFMTEYNIYSKGIVKTKSTLNRIKSKSPETNLELKSFKKMLSIIAETLKFGYNKEQDTISLERYYKLRLMNNYLEGKIVKDNIKISQKALGERDSYSLSGTKSGRGYPLEIKHEVVEPVDNYDFIESKTQPTTNDQREEFIRKVIETEYNNGNEAALLGFMRLENEIIYDKYFGKLNK